MKKLSLLFLITLSSSILLGCNNEVTYSEITEEEFNGYFAAEKVTAAKESFANMAKFYFINKQVNPEMTYNLSRYFDTNYFYEYAKALIEGHNGESHILYIGSSTLSDCHVYEVSTDDGKSIKDGEQAQNTYNYAVSNGRTTITSQIDNPFAIVSQYFTPTVKQYYIGSDSSIKAFGKSEDGKRSGYVVFNGRTLLPSSTKVVVDYEDEVGSKASVSFSYSYNTNFVHKTPHDIGYN